MFVTKKDRLAVYSYLFKEGVCVAPKNFQDQLQHQDIEGVANLVVINLMKSLTSREYVRTTFNWQWYYYKLTNEGIDYLREYLHVSADTVPATLKKATKPQPPPSFGQFSRDGGKGKGGKGGRRDGGDRDGYRGRDQGEGSKETGAPGEFRPEFGDRRGGKGFGRGGGKAGGKGRGGKGAQ